MVVHKRSAGEYIFDGFNAIFLIALVLVTLYPFLHVVFSSVSDPRKLATVTGILWGPQGFSLKGYELAFQHPGVTTGYANTIFYVGVGTAMNVFFTGLFAYVLASKAYWKNAMMIFVVITMFFQGGLIPLFLLVKGIGLLNTRMAIILPTLIQTWNLIIMRTFFQGIPDSLEESAVIDGANSFTIFFRIIIPLSMPVIAVMTLYYGVFHWNSWFQAMIFLRDRGLYPLQLFLREILIQQQMREILGELEQMEDQVMNVNRDILEAAFIIISTVPILALYPFLQRYFIKGVMIGALKG